LGNCFVGKRGESALSEALQELPNDYVLLNDPMLPDGSGNVVHLVIGPNGRTPPHAYLIHDHGSRTRHFIGRSNSAKPPSIASPDLRRAIVHHLHLLQQNPDGPRYSLAVEPFDGLRAG
jgi:hypothetical protein